jgi:polyisoprenoid-binding protein YceI
VINADPTITGDMATEPPRPTSGGRFTIDATRTFLTVRSRRFGMPASSTVWGLTGELEVPDELRATSLRATVQPGAVITGAPWRWMRSRRAARTGGVVGGATLTAGRLQPILDSYTTPDGDRPLWALDGELTLRGCSRRVRVALCVLRPARDGRTVDFEATLTLRPTDFGLAGGPGRGAEMHVRIVGVAVTC